MKINVVTVPNAKHEQVERLDEITYKVHLNAPAKQGRANSRLIEILSEYFHIPKSLIEIKAGHRARTKIVQINN